MHIHAATGCSEIGAWLCALPPPLALRSRCVSVASPPTVKVIKLEAKKRRGGRVDARDGGGRGRVAAPADGIDVMWSLGVDGAAGRRLGPWWRAAAARGARLCACTSRAVRGAGALSMPTRRWPVVAAGVGVWERLWVKSIRHDPYLSMALQVVGWGCT